MSLLAINRLLAELITRPAPEKRATRLFDAIMWRLLAGLAVIFLLLAGWRVLELNVGPILAPLIMAVALASGAAVLAFLEARRRKHLRAATPPMAPVIATVLEIAFAPKAVRWFALGSLLFDVLTGSSPLATRPRRRS